MKNEAAEYRSALHERGITLGLQRMERAMALCDEIRPLRVVHVAGTNGKGSTARMIQSMLTAAGYRTGLYTSPAVIDLAHTITIDSTPIPQETLSSLTLWWRERQAEMGECGELSEFELVTALAMQYFSRERVDICVLECGLGGRLDATNVCPPPLCAVFTPIATDHTAFLGDTVEAIAKEKCGIMKPPCRVVTSPAQSPEALAVIYEEAAARGLTVRQPNGAATKVISVKAGETVFAYAGEEYTLSLGGGFQVENALTALETVSALAECGYTVSTKAKKVGLAVAFMPCRQEVICRDPWILLDGGHNPHAVAELARTVQQLPQPLTLMIGMLRDKDTAACAAMLAPLAARVICCTPQNERALPAHELAGQFAAAGAANVCVIPEISQALSKALALLGEGALLVCGSFYTAGVARESLKNRL